MSANGSVVGTMRLAGLLSGLGDQRHSRIGRRSCRVHTSRGRLLQSMLS